MSAAIEAALLCLGRHEPAILVRIAEVAGSTPREAGTAMLVTESAIAGTVGGGQLEWRAIEVAREMLADERRTLELRLPLGPALAQCCGGYVALSLQRLAPEDAVALRTDLAAADASLPLVALFGAGHVGRAVATALSPLPCRLQWIDPRPDAFPAAASRRTAIAVEADPVAAVAQLPGGVYVLIMTHSHPLDLDLVEAALRRDDTAWVGLIGSATKRARFEGQLRARGLGPEAIDRLVCPIGITGIEGKEPAVIAVAVAAQFMMAFEANARRGASA
ncbi:MAG: xanthine dehydrogenase accessory protein XdhC [Geminicoccaceae bacterium]